MYKRLYIPTLLAFSVLTLSLISVQESKATHVMGSDIQFICQGDSVYHIRMVVHRDCNGIPMQGTETLEWNGLDGNCGGAVTLTRTGYEDVTPVCGEQCTACETGCTFDYGMEEHIYEGTIDLSNDNCDEYEFWYYRPARNDMIDNIESPGTSVYRLEAYLNTDVEDCPTTPEYTMDPVAIYCKDQSVIYNHGIQVPEGDSVVFDMVNPLQGSGNSGSYVNWSPGYKADEPLDYLGKGFPGGKDLPFPYGFHLDSATGDLMFTPTSTMVAIMSIGVRQYRGDTLVSQTQRDLQVVVMDCPDNDPPIVEGSFYNNEVCENSPISLPFKITDPDSLPPDPDSVFIDWNAPSSLDEAEFIPDSGLIYGVGVFNWTPQQGDAGSYSFVVQGRDNACPVPAQVARAVLIDVKPQPRASITTDPRDCGQVVFNANLINVSNATITWDGEGGLSGNGDSVSHTYNKPGKYAFTVTLLHDNCQNTIYDTVEVSEFLTVDAGNDVDVCQEEPFSITPTTEYEEGSVDFHWSTGDSNQPSMTYAFNEDTSVIVTAIDEVGCINSDTVFVNVTQNPVPDLGDDQRICEGTSIEIGSGFPDAYHHEWTNLYGNQFMSNDTSISFSDSGSYMLEVTDTTAQSCYGADTIAIFVNPEVKAEADPDVICEGDESVLSAEGGNEFEWRDMEGNTLSTDQQFTVSPTENTDYVIVAHSTVKGVYCEDVDTITVYVNELPDIETPELGRVCEDITTHFISNSTPNADSITGPTMDGSLFSPDEAGPGNHEIVYHFTDANACYNSASAYITVDPLPEVEAMEDMEVCSEGDMVRLTATPSGGEWTGHAVVFDGTDYWFNPSDATPTSHTLNYSYQDEHGCENNDEMRIRVFQSPEIVDPGSYGPLCIDDGRILLEANISGPDGEREWSGAGLTNETYFDPAEAGVGTHELTIYYETSNGCSDMATTDIVVNDTPHVQASVEGEIALICETADAITLEGSPTGPGGTWSGGSGGINQVDGTFDPAAAGPGIHELTYTYVNQHGCDNEDTYVIEVEAAPTIRIESDSPLLCGDEEEERSFEATAIYANAEGIEWEVEGDGQISDASSASIEYIPGNQDRASGTFTLRVRTLASEGQVCDIAEDEIVVEMHPRPETAFSMDPPEGCRPLEVQFYDETEISEGEITGWEWDLGDGNVSSLANPVHTYEEAGTYEVTMRPQSAEGCYGDRITKEIVAFPRPRVNFRAEPVLTTILTPTIQFENQTTEITEGTEYTWNFGDHETLDGGVSNEFNPSYQYSDTGRYTIRLEAVNEYDCDDYHEIENYIIVEPDITVYIPSAFSPNETGPEENRTFYAVVRGVVDYNLHVYNRWGSLIFESEHPDDKWDGTLDGREKAPEDVYTYLLIVTGFDGKEYKYSGTVTLIR